ncbi:RNA polymerase subunit sigma [Amycolatopsis antarctica]|uniref:RNA polymerase subunit sigma n=2 Tax=Amycolatopsis antarctica TaxID=1854586 RepID=A0A263CVI1_9PSEU|nr:RNA polymerase subunit sigma [Amycolatopsis antarctica]
MTPLSTPTGAPGDRPGVASADGVATGSTGRRRQVKPAPTRPAPLPSPDRPSPPEAVPRLGGPSRVPAGTRLTTEQLDPLVRAASTGDRAAVATLLAAISPTVTRYCRARLGGRDLSYVSADDVAQEACLAVLTALPAYQDRGGSFLYLVHAITSNKIADAFRKVSRDRSDPVPEPPEAVRPGTENAPERSALDGDLRSRLEGLLAHLPQVQQEILVLRVIVGLSANETAEAVGMTPGNVRTTQHRALARLRGLAGDEAW